MAHCLHDRTRVTNRKYAPLTTCKYFAPWAAGSAACSAPTHIYLPGYLSYDARLGTGRAQASASTRSTMPTSKPYTTRKNTCPSLSCLCTVTIYVNTTHVLSADKINARNAATSRTSILFLTPGPRTFASKPPTPSCSNLGVYIVFFPL